MRIDRRKLFEKVYDDYADFGYNRLRLDEALDKVEALIDAEIIAELEGSKIKKLNMEKFTTERAEMYNIAADDLNAGIDSRIAKLKAKETQL